MSVEGRFIWCIAYCPGLTSLVGTYTVQLVLADKSWSGTFNFHDLNKRNAYQWLVRFRTEPFYHLSAKQLFPPLIRHLNGTIVNRSYYSLMECQLKLKLKKIT